MNDLMLHGLIGGGEPAIQEWVRPADWLVLPTILDTDERFVGLYAIHPNGNNFCTLNFTTSAGNYEVDWGDGTVETFASNVKAEHEYNYATYDVPEATLSTRGYKQAIVSVTPVSGDLTTFNLQERFTGQTVAYNTGWLDIIMSTPNHTTGTSTFGGFTIRHSSIQQFVYLNLGLKNELSSFFNNCQVLGSISLGNTSLVTSMSSMFSYCYSLQSVSLFSTVSVTNMNDMFTNCHSLQSVPLFNTVSVTSMTGMFSYCHSLQSVPLFNTASVTGMNTMFESCHSLRSVPLFNTILVDDMENMFRDCYSLQSIPLFNTVSVFTMSGMFRDCYSLKSVPLFNTVSVTSMSSMFNNCYSLQSVPLFNTSLVFSMNSMFSFCVSLESIPLFDTSSVSNMGFLFSDCRSLHYIPALSTAGITTTTGSDFGNSFAANCNSLDACDMIFARTVTLSSGQLSRDEIVNIFNNLVDRSATTSATINVSGNYGTTTLSAADRLIATDKNWTINPA